MDIESPPHGIPDGAVDVTARPSGTVCAECEAEGGWWLHLRRCAACGHIGCCESSPARHARAHAEAAGHPIVRSFEPGERWFWSYATSRYVFAPELAPPVSRPEQQTSPGPAGRVPPDWRDRLLPLESAERRPGLP